MTFPFGLSYFYAIFTLFVHKLYWTKHARNDTLYLTEAYLFKGGARRIMYINSGYLHNSLLDFKDKSKSLVVGKLWDIPADPPAQASHVSPPGKD